MSPCPAPRSCPAGDPGVAPLHRHGEDDGITGGEPQRVEIGDRVDGTGESHHADRLRAVESIREEEPAALRRGNEAGVGAVVLSHDHRVPHIEVIRRAVPGTVTGRGQVLTASCHHRCQHEKTDCLPHASDPGPKAAGSSSPMVQLARVLRPIPSTGRSAPNSDRTWRQAPHGAAGGSMSLTITIRRKRLLPCVTAVATAARSAQMVSPYDAFSTLQPANTRPSSPSRAAPTRKCE